MILFELRRHRLAYAILTVGLVVFLVAFFAAWPDRMIQRLLVLAVAAFYAVWGIVTHFKSAHITRQVVIEYLGMSVLAAVLLLLVTL